MIYRELGHPDAATVRRQLDSLAGHRPQARLPGVCR